MADVVNLRTLQGREIPLLVQAEQSCVQLFEGAAAALHLPVGRLCLSHNSQIVNVNERIDGLIGDVVNVTVLPTPTLVSSGYHDCGLRMWILEGKLCMGRLEGHSHRVKDVSVDFDALRAVSCSQDCTLRVWDLDSFACIAVLEGHRKSINVVRADFRTHRALSGAADCELRLWDLSACTCIGTFTIGYLPPSNFSDNGGAVSSLSADFQAGLAASGCEHGVLHIWNLQAMTLADTLEFSSRSGRLQSLCADFQLQQAVAGYDNGLCFWDLASKTCRNVVKGWIGIRFLEVDFVAKRVVTASPSVLHVWDFEEMAQLDADSDGGFDVEGFRCLNACMEPMAAYQPAKGSLMNAWSVDFRESRCAIGFQGGELKIADLVNMSQEKAGLDKVELFASTRDLPRTWPPHASTCPKDEEIHTDKDNAVAEDGDYDSDDDADYHYEFTQVCASFSCC